MRLKETATLGTVVRVGISGRDEGGGQITVEWDGREGVEYAAAAQDLDYVRPPPRGW